MAHTCRGTIPLAKAHIEVGDTCHLVLTSGGRSYHLKATSEGECQRWVSALQQAKANATLLMHHSGKWVLYSSDWMSLCTGESSCANMWWMSPHSTVPVQRNVPESVLQKNNMVHLRTSELDKLILAVTWMQPQAAETHLPKCTFPCSLKHCVNNEPQEGSVDQYVVVNLGQGCDAQPAFEMICSF